MKESPLRFVCLLAVCSVAVSGEVLKFKSALRLGGVPSSGFLTPPVASLCRRKAVASMETGEGAASAPPKLQFITNRQCPFAQKTWIALEESGMPYEMKEISLYGSGGKPG
eukprot:Cvel_25680.t1-p1 / transcript=Cvel_25680.t1 / gene=Cvel_25680 / organism=Chromera_velia_CCMP2878 / gene_product=hypothetical protein / transcript_product=hypothetical protein / location=Cvel_scaffold2943:21157-21569(+) / protein_length=110 / sequence_SO=supercontig / SO=protein_coding / is_pseudo=false